MSLVRPPGGGKKPRTEPAWLVGARSFKTQMSHGADRPYLESGPEHTCASCLRCHQATIPKQQSPVLAGTVIAQLFKPPSTRVRPGPILPPPPLLSVPRNKPEASLSRRWVATLPLSHIPVCVFPLDG